MRWASTVLRETNRAAAASTLLSPRPTARATLEFLRAEGVQGGGARVVPGTGPDAGGGQFGHRPGCPRPRSQAVEDGEGVPEGPTGSGGTAGAAQRLALAEQRAGLLERHRLLLVGRMGLGEPGLGLGRVAGEDPARPRGRCPRVNQTRRVGPLLEPGQDLSGPFRGTGPRERLGEVTGERDDVGVAQPSGLSYVPGALQVVDRRRQVTAAERAQPERRRVMDGQAADTTRLDVLTGPLHVLLAPFTVTPGGRDPGQL